MKANDSQPVADLFGKTTTLRVPAGTELVVFDPRGVPEDCVDRVAREIQEAYMARDVTEMYERLRPEIGWENAYERIAEEYPISTRKARSIVTGH
jgi:hypothetical protein